MKESLVGTLKWIEGNGVVPAMDVEANARKNMSSLYRHADTTTRINVSNFASLHALQLLYNTLDQPYYSSKFSHIISYNVYDVACIWWWWDQEIVCYSIMFSWQRHSPLDGINTHTHMIWNWHLTVNNYNN